MATHDRQPDSTRPARSDRPTRRSTESGASGLLDLQRKAGNAAVASLISLQRQQTKADDEDVREET